MVAYFLSGLPFMVCGTSDDLSGVFSFLTMVTPGGEGGGALLFTLNNPLRLKRGVISCILLYSSRPLKNVSPLAAGGVVTFSS